MKVIERKFKLKEVGVFEVSETAEKTDYVDIKHGLEVVYKLRADIKGFKSQRIGIKGQMDDMIVKYNTDLEAIDEINIPTICADSFYKGDNSYVDELTLVINSKINVFNMKKTFDQLEVKIKNMLSGYNMSVELMNEANSQLNMGVEGIPSILDLNDMLSLEKPPVDEDTNTNE